MTPEERIRISLLQQKMKTQSEFSKKLGLVDISIKKGEQKNED